MRVKRRLADMGLPAAFAYLALATSCVVSSAHVDGTEQSSCPARECDQAQGLSGESSSLLAHDAGRRAKQLHLQNPIRERMGVGSAFEGIEVKPQQATNFRVPKVPPPASPPGTTLPYGETYLDALPTAKPTPMPMVQPLKKTLSREELAKLAELTKDCVLSEWSEWSECGPQPGQGLKSWARVRKRHMINPVQVGGKDCETGADDMQVCTPPPSVFGDAPPVPYHYHHKDAATARLVATVEEAASNAPDAASAAEAIAEIVDKFAKSAK